MLDRLPTELLHLVISLIAPNDYNKHRRALYACSLVSKIVKDAAQPVLWRKVVCDRREQVDSILAGRSTRLAGCTRELDVQGFHRAETDQLLAAVDQVQRVRLFSLFSYRMIESVQNLEPVRWCVLPALNIDAADSQVAPYGARAAYLSGVMLSATALSNLTFGAFARLTSLTLHPINSPSYFLDQLLSPATVPALESLALEYLSSFACPYFPFLSDPFLRQLDMLQLPLAQLDVVPASYFLVETAILWIHDSDTIRVNKNQQVNPRHLALHGLGVHVLSSTAAIALAKLVDVVNAPWSRLESVWLRPYLQSRTSIGIFLRTLVDELRHTCEAQSVHLGWHEGQGDNADGQSLDESFWRYARETKAKRRDGNA